VLSEEVIKELISTPAFLTNCNKLAYMLHISHQDASQELLLELLDHRLRTWSNKDVTMAITKDLPSLKWRIKYARLDLVRKAVRDVNRELTKSQMMAGMEPQASNEAETLEALKKLPEIFKNANTRDWCGSILRVGKRQTMMNFHQTPRQFGNKLNKVCKYCHQHRQPKQPNSNAGELKLLKEWDSIMANETTDDNDIQDFINSHQDYINEVINSPQVAFQGRLIKDFAHAGKDKFVLVDLMAKREQELDRRTNHE
jgi:hypothetical protein